MLIEKAYSSNKMTTFGQILISSVFVLAAAQTAVTHGRNYAARNNSGNKLISSVVNDCLKTEVFDCVNQKVLNFLDAFSNTSFKELKSSENMEETILGRVGRILATNKITVELPGSFFRGVSLVYQPDIGFDLYTPKQEGRGVLLKKKLFLPLLLLLKLKMKALMPILVALIGIKAMKALILSKIAIKIVLGFVIFQLIQKVGAFKMSMMPMTSTEAPMNVYGTPAPTPTSTNYESGWDQSSGPYARVWESPQSYFSHNSAYSGHIPKVNSISSPTAATSS